MTYIYLDESGDLGFNFQGSNTSRFFLCAAVITKNPVELERLVRKTVAKLHQYNNHNLYGLLHAYREKPVTIKRILTQATKKNIQIAMTFIDKTQLNHKLSNMSSHELYLHLTAQLIDKLVLDSEYCLIASQRDTKRSLNENFIKRLESKFQHLQVLIKKPQEEKCLQIADFVSWSFFNKYEHACSEYTKLFSKQILFEYEVLT